MLNIGIKPSISIQATVVSLFSLVEGREQLILPCGSNLSAGGEIPTNYGSFRVFFRRRKIENTSAQELDGERQRACEC